MAKRSPTHWACWNYPGTRIYTACQVNRRRYRRLWPELECSAAEYVAAYEESPLGFCATCRKKAEWYDKNLAQWRTEQGLANGLG